MAPTFKQVASSRGVIIAAGIAAFVVYLTAVVTWLSSSVHQEQSEVLARALGQLDDIIVEGRSILVELNAFDDESCTPALIRRMRQTEFLSLAIRDIGFIQDGSLVCTTGVGVLAEPRPLERWDYIAEDGSYFVANADILLFDGTVNAPAVWRGRYSLVFEERLLGFVIPDHYQFEIVQRVDGVARHTLGLRGLYRGLDQSELRTLTDHFYEGCSLQTPQCIALRISNWEFLSRNVALLRLLLVFGVLFSLLAAGLTWLIMQRQLSVQHRLQRGLRTGAFYPVFQPIVDLNSGEVIGCEILARFKDRFGPLSPAEFIPMIGIMQRTLDFTNAIYNRAMTELVRADVRATEFKVALNIFAADMVLDSLDELDVFTKSVDSRFVVGIELTEHEDMDSDLIGEFVRAVRSRGIEISIDDFGTGYSNLNRIQDFKSDVIKIDRSFVQGLDEISRDESLIPFIIRLAQHHGMKVLAEGIETEQQHSILKNFGIAYGQGYLLGRPMSANGLSKQVDDSNIETIPASHGT
ncbi:MAG: EAL domain-containing protein [Saccharospirillum sp.]|uniref:EAL domain-containing protein n=1 Tax=Saccharospirillum sp. TaxID=2033801 RepID=UPI00329812EC